MMALIGFHEILSWPATLRTWKHYCCVTEIRTHNVGLAYVSHLKNDRSARGSNIVLFPPTQQEEEGKTKDARGNEVGSPITVVTSNER